MADCATNTVDIKEATASGTNGVAVSAPTVFQYPVQPPRDDGRMLAIASLISSLIDTAMGGDSASFALAKDAEAKWSALVDKLKEFGTAELDRVGTQRNKLPQYELDLEQQYKADRANADDMIAWAKQAKACADTAYDALCAFAECGYVPQYAQILYRAKADTAASVTQAMQDSCRMADRYGSAQAHNAAMHAALAGAVAYVGAGTAAVESERQFAWKTNADIKFRLQEASERVVESRHKLGMAYDAAATAISTERWRAYEDSAFKSMREAGEMLASAAQAYQMLAASARMTAKQDDGGGWAGILLKLGATLGLFSGSCDPIGLFGVNFYPRPQVCCSAA